MSKKRDLEKKLKTLNYSTGALTLSLFFPPKYMFIHEQLLHIDSFSRITQITKFFKENKED